MIYDFSTKVNRRNTLSLKWDSSFPTGDHQDPLAMWVADMDFTVPAEINEALAERVNHGIYGYPVYPESYTQAFVNWFKKRHNWDASHLHFAGTSGVVPALYACINFLTKPADKVLIQTPVYYPFYNAVNDTGRVLQESSLIRSLDVKTETSAAQHTWSMDFADLEAQFKAGTKAMILCNPHNPAGRVWTGKELSRLAELADRFGVFIISDEIHADILIESDTFTSFDTVAKNKQYCILSSPSKTFNLGGLPCGVALFPEKAGALAYQKSQKAMGHPGPGLPGLIAGEAAYTKGADWVDALLSVLKKNWDLLVRGIADVPVSIAKLEGTYLAWLDFSSSGLEHSAIRHKLHKIAGLYVSDGTVFGTQGENCFRMNLACPESVVADAVERIKAVFGEG